MSLALCACSSSSAPQAAEPDAGADAGLLTDLAGMTAKTDLSDGGYGDALPRLSQSDLALFAAGRAAFIHQFSAADGLGPVFNAAFCSNCHDAPPAIGGTNQRVERRYGHRNTDGSFDPLTAQGGTLLHDTGIGAVDGGTYAGETIPAAANVVAGRRTQPVFGLSLVEATPDSSFRAIAAYQAAHSPAAAGRAATVTDLSTGLPAVGRFGWKSAIATLFQFSGDAALNEMGITSPQFPNDVCPNGDCSKLSYNPAPGMNDPGGVFVAQFNDFMQFLGPPPAPTLSGAAIQGQQVFASIGCAVCHLPLLVTGPNTNPAFDQIAYHPYSDFLLHDMGSLGDGILQADAQPGEMRTQPLWGLGKQTALLHDARTASPSEAIAAHDGQGKSSRDAFAALSDDDRAALLEFLAAL
ncbi:MAG TPA: di-heme oxidoredictase family protein [Myxococcales bacterium]|nr:di-heme oxidoredictase family protein [Myxococcales bacterium]